MELVCVKEDIWEQYKRTRSAQLRNKILLSYLDIVKYNVKRMNSVYRNHAEMEDLINEGVLVLMDCIEKYDPSRGVKFDTYASIRVRGSIIDYVRSQDWVPRSLRKKAKDIDEAYTKLQRKHGRTATDDEVASELGITTNEFNKVLGETKSFNFLSFEELLYENATVFSNNNSKTPESELQSTELKKYIAKFIDELSDKERTVISLYYYEELKLKDIAEVLELTVSRVSQLHSKALQKLKVKIKKYMEN